MFLNVAVICYFYFGLFVCHFYRTAFNTGRPSCEKGVCPSVCLSVCLSVKRVNSDKTEEKSVHTFAPYEDHLA